MGRHELANGKCWCGSGHSWELFKHGKCRCVDHCCSRVHDAPTCPIDGLPCMTGVEHCVTRCRMDLEYLQRTGANPSATDGGER